MSSTPYAFIASLIDQVPEIPPDSIVSRTLFTADHLKVVLFGFAPGQELSEHTASTPAVIHILSGECLLTLGQESHLTSAGAWVHMEANLPHSLRAQTPVVMLLLLLR
jgi:quercetin dioxygenase-like cupin family protein